MKVNYEFANPTKLIIKEDASIEVADYIAQDGITSVMILTGAASVKKMGLFDKVVTALKQKNIDYIEFSGIRANPELKTACQIIDICRSKKVQAIVPIGGGSVFDTAKVAAVGSLFPAEISAESVWDCFERTRTVEKALPIYGVLTISASGTEMDQFASCQNDEQKKKFALISPHIFPKVSIIDPKIQTGLPWFQQVNGFVDAIMHIFEAITNVDEPETVETTFSVGIALVKSIIKCGDRLKQDKADLNARASFAWAAACGLNQVSSIGISSLCLGVHLIEDAISAKYPEISHGAGLGVVFPAFVRVIAEDGYRLRTYDRIAREVFGKEGWKGLIEGWVQMLQRWGHPTTLNNLFGRVVSQEERDELIRIYMFHPSNSNKPDQNPETIVKKAYGYM